MNAVEELIARDKIRQLAERYAVGVDGKDLDGIAALFALDVDNGPYGPGREGIRNLYDHELRKYHCTMHFVGNHVIDFDDDDHAHGIVYCRAYHHVPEPEHWFDVAVAYWDTYDRIGNDEWVFRRRQPTAWYRQPWGHPDQPNDRKHIGGPDAGARRGAQMPEAFPTWTQFWANPPRPMPPESP